MTAKNDINPHLNTIMEMINWPDDAFVPVANDENRHLMEHLQQLIVKKENQENHLKQLDQRVKLLTDHYQNAQSDVLQNLVFIQKKIRFFSTNRDTSKAMFKSFYRFNRNF